MTDGAHAKATDTQKALRVVISEAQIPGQHHATMNPGSCAQMASRDCPNGAPDERPKPSHARSPKLEKALPEELIESTAEACL